MKNPFDSIDPKMRGIIYLIITVVAIVAAFMIIKVIAKAIKDNKDKKDPKKVVTDAEGEYKNLLASGETLSYSPSAYSSSANAIKLLLDGCETSSSELDAIREVIKVVKAPIDWYYLVKTFGVKKIDNCGFWTGDEEYDLSSLLKDQLDSATSWNINLPNYKNWGVTQNSVTILETYLQSIGVNF